MRCSVRIARPNDTTTIANRPAKAKRLRRTTPGRAAAPASATDTTSTTADRSIASPASTGSARHPNPVSHNQHRSPTPCPAPATAPSCPGTASLHRSACTSRRSAPSPPQPTNAADGPGRCRHAPAVNATSPPTANSHARVGSEKNAHDGQLSVHANDTVNDAAASSPSTRTYGATDRTAVAPVRLATPREKPCRADDQRRPEQIELLLHAQRPVVLHRRRRRIGRQIVGALDREPVVADIQRAGDAVTDDAARLQRRQQHRRRDTRRDKHRHRSGKQPSRASRVEPGQPHRAATRRLAPQQTGDQESRRRRRRRRPR